MQDSDYVQKLKELYLKDNKRKLKYLCLDLLYNLQLIYLINDYDKDISVLELVKNIQKILEGENARENNKTNAPSYSGQAPVHTNRAC